MTIKHHQNNYLHRNENIIKLCKGRDNFEQRPIFSTSIKISGIEPTVKFPKNCAREFCLQKTIYTYLTRGFNLLTLGLKESTLP